jgi:hypothetical protein
MADENVSVLEEIRGAGNTHYVRNTLEGRTQV